MREHTEARHRQLLFCLRRSSHALLLSLFSLPLSLPQTLSFSLFPQLHSSFPSSLTADFWSLCLKETDPHVMQTVIDCFRRWFFSSASACFQLQKVPLDLTLKCPQLLPLSFLSYLFFFFVSLSLFPVQIQGQENDWTGTGRKEEKRWKGQQHRVMMMGWKGKETISYLLSSLCSPFLFGRKIVRFFPVKLFVFQHHCVFSLLLSLTTRQQQLPTTTQDKTEKSRSNSNTNTGVHRPVIFFSNFSFFSSTSPSNHTHRPLTPSKTQSDGKTKKKTHEKREKINQEDECKSSPSKLSLLSLFQNSSFNSCQDFHSWLSISYFVKNCSA